MNADQELVNAEFGRRLRERRGSRPRWQVGMAAGLSPETIGRYERGDGGPSIADAQRIARALDCRVSDLLPDEDEAAPGDAA